MNGLNGANAMNIVFKGDREIALRNPGILAMVLRLKNDTALKMNA